MCRRRKQAFENELLLDVEQAFQDGEIRNAYRHLKQLREGFKLSTFLGRDKNNTIISDTERIKATWSHYFEELVGTPT